MSVSSGMASRLWSRASTLSRDSFTLSKAFATEVAPILRRQQTQRTVGDAFRNVLVTQARQSNLVAASLLSFQQQMGLLRYHGFLGYWRQGQGQLQAAGNVPGSNFVGGGRSGMSTLSNNGDSGNNSNGVAQVAFMITSAMRKELSENLAYTADDIKSMTPIEASLILFHKVRPEQKDQELPGLLQAHEAEQERIRKEQEESQARAEEQRQIQEQQQQQQQQQQAKTAEMQLPLSTPPPPSSSGDEKEPTLKNRAEATANDFKKDQKSSSPSSQKDPREGVNRWEDRGMSTVNNNRSSKDAYDYLDDDAPLGSFVASMEERADVEREWYEVVETRVDDHSQAPVGLFSNLEEAEMAMDLKRTFAERRAKEDIYNKENKPVTTYSIQKTIK